MASEPFVDIKESPTTIDRTHFYFVNEKVDILDDDTRLREIAKRYNYLLDISPLFKAFIDARASKDSKFRSIVEKVEQTNFVSILNGSHNAKSAKATNKNEIRQRKSEKEEDAELLKNDDFDDNSGIIEFTESPTYIHGKLREYQIQGLNWLISLHENHLSGILADEMGLGKTLQTISFLGYLRFFKGVVGPHLVIVPKSTLENWQREFGKWIPEFKPVILTGDKEQRSDIISNKIMKCDFDVLISSYEIVIKEKATLKKVFWNYIIIDEAHRIKNEQSLLSQVIRLFTSRNRLLITGTPLQNNLHELWALLNFILPDVFTDSEQFDTYFGGSASNATDQKGHEDPEQHQEIIKQLHTILSPFLLRRIKAQVEKSLLPKKELNLYVTLSPLQKKLYKKLLEKDLDAVNGLNGKKESKTRLLNIVMQLRKCCNHPYLFDGVEPGPPYTTDEHLVYNSEKLKVLDKMLKKFKKEGSRVLIFSQMSRMLDIMEDFCFFRGYQYNRIDGSTEHEDRIKQIDEYNAEDSEKFIFLLTTRAGGLGINLTSADIVVLFDSDWNPQADLQAMDRAHRIGQKKQVKVFRMVTDNSIEEKVLERAMKKLRLDQVVIQQARALPSNTNQKMEKDELLNMIRYGAQDIFDNKTSESKDGEDFDLDSILENSEKKTKELNSKYAKLGFDELQELNDDQSSTYTWNGTDFKKQQTTQKIGSGLMYLNPGKRERKENYSIDAYYRDALSTSGRAASTEPKAPRPPKQLQLYDHQFYNPNLLILHEKEKNWFKKQSKYQVPIPTSSEHGKSLEVLQNKAKFEQLQVDNAEPLTEEQEKIKENYIEEGFGNWSRREFNYFIQLSGRYGRSAIDRIAYDFINHNVVTQQKTYEEVVAYSDIFWVRYTEIDGFEKYIHQIEQGEEKIAKQLKQQKCLHKKIAQYSYPLEDLKLLHPPSSATFTAEEDAFLLVQLYKHGVDSEGIYETIHKEILKSNIFKFDYFLKSRTNTELNRRCNSLLANVVKEFDTLETQMKTELTNKKRALSAAKGVATKRQKAAKEQLTENSVKIVSKNNSTAAKATKGPAVSMKVELPPRKKPGPAPGTKYASRPGPKKKPSSRTITEYFKK